MSNPKITMIATDKLIPYARNPRTHSDDQVGQIAASIKEFGWLVPVVVDAESVLIAGHGRVLAAQKLGIDKIPTIDGSHLTPAQVQAFRIAENKLALNAGWDDELLKIELGELMESDYGIDFTGFSEDEISKLMGAVEGKTDPDEAPEPLPDAVSEKGEVWILGAHRVLCGDATSIEDIDRLMAGESADLVFTSPPYNVGIKYDSHDDNMGGDEYKDLICGVLLSCYTAMAEGRIIAWNVGVSPKSKPHHHAIWLEECGFMMFRHIVWKKTGAQIPLWQNTKKNPVARNYMPNYNHEVFHLFSKGPVEYGATTVMPEELSMDVWDVSQFSAGGTGHPAAFPVALAQHGISALSGTGESIIDPFGGSGTTLIACERLSRCCRMMEIDPRYCDVIIRRWQEFTGKQAHLEGQPEALFDARQEAVKG
jgi:DNA modification methylase